jgi:diacylglycerol kinase
LQFLKSFQCAFRGIVYCINTERNMRIHTVAALYVFVFSFFFEMSRARYAVIFLTIAMVMMAELLNTALEELSDLTTTGYHPVIRSIKDMAAGGVLVCAFFSVIVGVCIFWQPGAFVKILRYFSSNPMMLILLLLLTALCVVYIAMGPIGIRNYIRKKRDK